MAGNHLFFSIIIPTYNRPQALQQCLGSLAQLDYPHDLYEVVVVDDGSLVSLEKIVASFATKINIKLERLSNNGPANARNKGAQNAQGNILAFTDDDCAPEALWLKKLSKHFLAKECRAVGGLTINAFSDNLCAQASQLLLDYLYNYYNADPQRATFLTSNNLALPKDEFLKAGGFKSNTFHMAAGEDREFSHRWVRLGHPMLYDASIIIYHYRNMALGDFWRQHFRYGQGAWLYHELRAKTGQGRIKIEPLSFYMNLLKYPFFVIRPKRAVLISALLVISQLSNALGYFLQKFQIMKKANTPNVIS